MLYKFYFISLSPFYLEIIFQFWLLLFYVIVNILLLLLLLFVVVRNLTSSFCVCLCSFFGGWGWFCLLQGKAKDIELKGHTDSVDQLCWDPKHADLIATASGDKTVRLWDARSK